MNDFPGYARAQREYDNRTPPDDGPSECPDCSGSGWVNTWVADEADRSGQSDRREDAECPACQGSGYINDDGSPYDPDQAERDADEYADMKRSDP